MDDINSISDKDRAIFQNLLVQEKIGEEGFAKVYHGDPSGAKQIENALRNSAANIRSIQNSPLHHQAKDLLSMLNQAIAQYMKNPSDENLGTLKSGVDQYKDFLDQYQ